MNIQMIGLVLNIILSLVQNISSSKAVDNIIALLQSWMPTILNEAEDLVPLVTGIIETLKGSDILTADQVQAIDALNTQSDAEFDAAAAIALKGTN